MEKKKRDGDVKTAITTVVEETKAATNGPLVFSIRQQQSTGGNGGISTTAGQFTSLEENKGGYSPSSPMSMQRTSVCIQGSLSIDVLCRWEWLVVVQRKGCRSGSLYF